MHYDTIEQQLTDFHNGRYGPSYPLTRDSGHEVLLQECPCFKIVDRVPVSCSDASDVVSAPLTVGVRRSAVFAAYIMSLGLL
jgi:hypothetical protein